MEQKYQEYLAHFPTGISSEIEEYATEDVFKRSRYIFTTREGNQQHGYCTHCNTDFKTFQFKHNNTEICPNCKSICTVKAAGLGRKKMIDQAYFVYYEKSAISPSAIIARGIYAVRDYTGDYHGVDTQCVIKAYYIFEPGASTMITRSSYYSWDKEMWEVSCQKRNSVHSLFSQVLSNGWGGVKDIVIECSVESIRKAVKDTPFQYSTWESYIADDVVKFFGLYAKYPCIEYLTKLGFEELVKAKLYNRHTYGAVNWNGKSLLKVLKLSKNDLQEIKASKMSVDPLSLKLIQISKKDRSHLSFDEILELSSQYDYYFNDLKKILKYTSIRKADAYIKKQFTQKNQGDDKRKHWGQEWAVMNTWRDYIADCNRLEMDLTQEQILFPSNLYRAHQNTIAQVKVKGDAVLDKKIKSRIRSLEKYCFADQGLIIRPATCTAELIAEGKALNHCVGTYADRYAKGKIDLLVIRKAAEPDRPYFTVEIRKGIVAQCRGNKNCQPGNDVTAFMKAFTAEKLSQEKEKVAISA